jgi:hypothetical protein
MATQTRFLIIDTETTQNGNVADFGAIVTNRKGEILASCAVLVREYYLDRDNSPLFHHSKDADPLWGMANLPKRYSQYDAMLQDGRRMLASVAAVNRWLAKVNAKYSPIVTAYNLPFDSGKMENSGIDHEQFERRFCLYAASCAKWSQSKAYRQFILENVAFRPPTKYGNMTYITNAEVMARFITGNPDMPDEPHTAFEDARDYELPILTRLVQTTKTKDLFGHKAPNWRMHQVKDWFAPK